MKRYFNLMAIFLALALFAVLPILAQDQTVTEAVEPAAVITVEPAATQEVVIVVTATSVESVTPTQTTTAVPPVTQPPAPPPADTSTNVLASTGWVLFLSTLSALAFVVLTWMRDLRKRASEGDTHAKNLLTFVNAARDMLPVDELLKLVDKLDRRAKETPTPGEVDDKVSAQIRAYVYEALGKELPSEPPPAPVPPAPAAPTLVTD